MAGRRIVVEFLGKDKNLSKTANEVESKTSKMGAGIAKVGKAAGAGLAIAGVAAIGFGKTTLDAASRAQQSLGATQTVFGKFADAVVGNSNRAANSVGLSANAYRENANLIGSLFKNQGVASDKLAGKTDRMIKVGADLAATFGGTTKESVEALGSAFKGEYDPLERYGISLKESTVNAELAKRGQDKLTGSALAQAKQMAVTDLIMKQSKDSTGAFARESDTLAGAQQRLGAKFENLKSTLGEKLLPIATKVVSWASDLIDKFKSGEGAGGAFRKAFEAIGKVIKPIGEWIGNDLVPFIKDLAQRFKDAMGGTAGFKQTLSDLKPFIDIVKRILGVLWEGLKWAAKIVLPIVVTNIRVLAKALGTLGEWAKWLWNKAFQPAIQFIIRGIGWLMEKFADMLGALGKVPGFGWAKDAADAMHAAAKKANALAEGIKDIKDKKVTVNTVFTQTYKNSKGKTVTQHGPVATGIGYNARGTNNWRGGPTWVGEQGPELVDLPRGSRIIPAGKSARMAGGGTTVIINIHGVMDKQGAAREVRTALLNLKRNLGGGALGLA